MRAMGYIRDVRKSVDETTQVAQVEEKTKVADALLDNMGKKRGEADAQEAVLQEVATKKQVKEQARKTMEDICKTIANDDAQPFVSDMIAAVVGRDQLNETIDALGSTTFVQPCDAAALSLATPILEKGFKRNGETGMQRKCAVITENMSKLVARPVEVQEFAATLRPYLLRAKAGKSTRASALAFYAQAVTALVNRLTFVAAALTEALEATLEAVVASAGTKNAVDALHATRAARGRVMANIMLNNARLDLKKGLKYGIAASKSAGKTATMRAILQGRGHPGPQGRPAPSSSGTTSSATDQYAVLDTVGDVGGDVELEATEEQVREMLTECGYTEVMQNGPITSLSGGWKMKLALGRAKMQCADIMLMDEPTNHLDVINVQWADDLITSEALKETTCMTLKNYKGNVTAFVERFLPRVKSYFELGSTNIKFTFPTPAQLSCFGAKGRPVKRGTPIMSMKEASFTYPGAAKPQQTGVGVMLSLHGLARRHRRR
eukprot:g1959.t1